MLDNAQPLTHRKATLHDMRSMINLLMDDDLGQLRELIHNNDITSYEKAFMAIDNDPNHYLMVVEKNNEIVGTCHLTLIPSLTFMGGLRLHIEAVRISKKHQSHGIGTWMLEQALHYGRENNAILAQLTTHQKRLRTSDFYKRLGFDDTHIGMKTRL